MKTLHYITILTKEDHIISLMTEDYNAFTEYAVCTIGNVVNAYAYGGNKHDKTAVLCEPDAHGARLFSGTLLDATIITQGDDEYAPIIISPINQED